MVRCTSARAPDCIYYDPTPRVSPDYNRSVSGWPYRGAVVFVEQDVQFVPATKVYAIVLAS